MRPPTIPTVMKLLTLARRERGLTAFADRINAVLPFGQNVLSALNVLVSLA
jgi:hypothetical protein